MINETILAIIISFAISAVLCPIVIPFLHKLKFGQQVRDDGPQAHLKKQGTPTMGGLIILSSIIITSLFYIKDYPKVIPVLFVTVGCGIIGFLDDYIKIDVYKRQAFLLACGNGCPCERGEERRGKIICCTPLTFAEVSSQSSNRRSMSPLEQPQDNRSH